jgi:hypothetical protein
VCRGFHDDLDLMISMLENYGGDVNRVASALAS